MSMTNDNMDWVLEAQSYTVRILHKNRIKYINRRKKQEEVNKKREKLIGIKIDNLKIEVKDYISLCAKIKTIPGGLKPTQRAKVNLFLEKERNRLYTIIMGSDIPNQAKNSLIKKLSYASL